MKFNFAALERSRSEGSDSSAESVHVPDRLRASRTSVSGTSSTFASPRTAASSDSGGSSTVGGVSADTSVGLVLIENPAQICGGVIGAQSKGHFCILPAHECSAKSHKSSKFTLPLRACWFAKTKRNGAFLNIRCLDSSIPSEEIKEEMRTQERKVEVWRASFSSWGRELHVETSADDESMSELGSPSAADFSRAAEDLQTPRSVFVGRAVRSVSERPVQVPDLEELAALEFDGVLPQETEADKMLATILQEWHKFSTNFARLRSMFVVLADEQEQLSEGVLQDFNIIQGKANLVDSKIHLLKERIGHDAAASDGGIKTVWTAIAEFSEEFKNGKHVIDMMAKDLIGLQSIKSEWPVQQAAVERLQKFHESEYSEFHSDYEDTMKNLEIILVKFEERISGVENKRSGPSGRFARIGSGHSSPEGFVPESDFLELQERVVCLEREVRDLRGLTQEVQDLKSSLSSLKLQDDVEYVGTKSSRNATLQSDSEKARARAWEGGRGDMASLRESQEGNIPSSPKSTSEMFEHIMSEIEYFRSRIKSLETPNRGSGIEIDGLKFLSVGDTKIFLKRNPGLDVGTCTDPASAIANMGHNGLTGKEVADVLHSALRTGTSTWYNDLRAAMGLSRPPKLYAKGGKGDVGEISDGFLAAPTYDKWTGTGMDGVKFTLTTELDNYLTGLEGTLRGHDEGTRLARALILRVRAFWTAFVGFIELGYSKLKGSANFSDKASWNLMGRYGIAFFDAMSPYRSAASLLGNPDSLDDRAALLWAVLQCHRVTEEFIKLKWEGHPAIVRQTSLFMLTERVDPAQMKEVQKQLASLAAEFKHIGKGKQAAQPSDNKVDKLTDTVSGLQSTVTSLSTRVTDVKRSSDNTSHDLRQLKTTLKTKGAI